MSSPMSPHQTQQNMNAELDSYSYQYAPELLSSTPAKFSFHDFLHGNPSEFVSDFQSEYYPQFQTMPSPCESNYSQETDYALLELTHERESKLKLEEELFENFANCAPYIHLLKSVQGHGQLSGVCNPVHMTGGEEIGSPLSEQYVALTETQTMSPLQCHMNIPTAPSFHGVDQSLLISSQTTSEAPKRSRGRRASNKPDTTSGAKSFICEYGDCGKVFKRSEHLKRHIRSIHTLEKPFQCPYPTCSKRFSRSDNLNQHIRIHRHSKDKGSPRDFNGFTPFMPSPYNSGHL
ncbi:hypothetical protein K7432_011154 [Basidiobolus ranarum]|uniref:C2H2-type domain-containing protein n=1 Tax=Basidiobolus ranarum TaxID=34480 RepID=A0ABR2VUQ2_9FUNG